VAAWAGILASVLLIPATILASTAVAGQVDATAQAVDQRLAVGVPLAQAASQGADAVEAAAGTIAETADAVASGSGGLTPVLDQVASFSSAYQSLRGAYQAAGDAAGAAVDRLESIAAVLPEGMAENVRNGIAHVESLATQVEATATGLLDPPTVGVVTDVAGSIAGLARDVETAMAAIGEGLAKTASDLEKTRGAISVRSDEIVLGLTVLAIAVGAWLAYSAMLNVALLRLLPARPPRPTS
jgi:hypothetical protein